MESNGSSKIKMMTAREVSDLLKLPMTTLYEMAAKGKIRGIKCGRQWRFLESDVLNFIHGLRPALPPQPAGPEKRQFARIKTRISAKVTGLLPETSGLALNGIIHNLSEGGAFLVPELEGLEEGDPVKVIFTLADFDSHEIAIDARVVRKFVNSKTGTGIRFRHVLPETQEMIREYVG